METARTPGGIVLVMDRYQAKLIESLKLDLKVKQAHVDDLEDDLLTSQKEI